PARDRRARGAREREPRARSDASEQAAVELRDGGEAAARGRDGPPLRRDELPDLGRDAVRHGDGGDERGLRELHRDRRLHLVTALAEGGVERAAWLRRGELEGAARPARAPGGGPPRARPAGRGAPATPRVPRPPRPARRRRRSARPRAPTSSV